MEIGHDTDRHFITPDMRPRFIDGRRNQREKVENDAEDHRRKRTIRSR